MAVKSKYFEAEIFYYKVLVLCCFVLIDIFFNSFTQFVTFGVKTEGTTCHKDDYYLCFGLALIQFILIIVMIFVLLNIFSETIYFKRRLLGAICGKFLFSIIFLFLYPVFFLIERIVLVSLLNRLNEKGDEAPTINIWTSDYLVIYIIKYFIALCFYIGILRTAFELGKIEYYRIDKINK